MRMLSDVLDALDAAPEGEEVSVAALMEALGRSSFPTLVLAPSLVAVSPASSIPGMTSTVGLLVAAISAQMLLGRESAWLPGLLTRRRIAATRLRRAVGWLRRPVAAVERLARPRLSALVSRPLVAVPLAVMLTLGLTMPLMEVVPMSGSLAGALLSLYAIGLLVRDGALVALALSLSAALPLAVWHLAT